MALLSEYCVASDPQSGTLAGRPIVHVQFDAKHLPVVAIDYLAREGKQTPVFCPDQWSGLAIYRLYPHRLMVIDDRHDLYGSKRFQQYLVLIQGEPAWREVLNGWNIQTAMLPPKGTLANLLRELPQEWKEVYADDVAVIFEKQ